MAGDWSETQERFDKAVDGAVDRLGAARTAYILKNAMVLAERLDLAAEVTDGMAKFLQVVVEERHPRGDLTPLQILRLRQLKDLEETLEAFMATAQPAEMTTVLDNLFSMVRWHFRNRDWLAQDWVNERPSDAVLEALQQEMADEYITLLLKALVLQELTGKPVSLPVLAASKALTDLGRPKVDYHP